MRLGLLHEDLAYRFSIAISTVNNIITTWIQFLFHRFNRLWNIMFPSRKKIQKHLPKSFRKFKNVRVILDATEFFTQAPRNYEQQGNLYSSYKNYWKCKVLVGITQSGAISFISDVYESSISDKDIFKRSGILNRLNEILSWWIEFLTYGTYCWKKVQIVIPPYLGDRANLTPQRRHRQELLPSWGFMSSV